MDMHKKESVRVFVHVCACACVCMQIHSQSDTVILWLSLAPLQHTTLGFTDMETAARNEMSGSTVEFSMKL